MKTPNARTLRCIFTVLCLLGLNAFFLIESSLIRKYRQEQSDTIRRLDLRFSHILECRNSLDAGKTDELKNKAVPLKEYREFYQAVQTGSIPEIKKQLYQLEYDTAVALCDASNRNLSMLIRTIVKGSFFLLLFTLVLLSGYMLISRHLRKALQTLRDGTKELRTGNLEFRFKKITPDEIGEVKYDFNMMARRIEQQSGELRTANRELREQAEKLIEAHQHKDRFLSNMSHELRTPLNSIVGFSELIEARAEKLSPEKLKGYAGRILTAASHLLSLITALLDLAKSGAGTLKAVPAEFDLTFAIREMCDMLTPMAEKKGLTVHAEIEDGLYLNADARMIRQIFINLFSNAVKYTFSGSITIRLYQTEQSYVLSITDTGIGIPQSEQKHIFQDFHRVESAAKLVVDGVGIGLALSRRLAVLNRGTLRFTSTEGSGSTFTLELDKQP